MLIRRLTLVSRIVRELTLIRVDYYAHGDVDREDEDFGADETLPEVHGASHFSHEFVEKRSTAVSEDAVHQAIDTIRQRTTGGPVCTGYDGTFGDVVRREGGSIVWPVCRNDTHRHENDKDIQPY